MISNPCFFGSSSTITAFILSCSTSLQAACSKANPAMLAAYSHKRIPSISTLLITSVSSGITPNNANPSISLHIQHRHHICIALASNVRSCYQNSHLCLMSPTLEVVVIFPTPPFPDVITKTLGASPASSGFLFLWRTDWIEG